VSTATLPIQSPDSTLEVDGIEFYQAVAELCGWSDSNLKRSDYFNRCFVSICKFLQAEVALFNVRQGARTLERTYSNLPGSDNPWAEKLDQLVLRAQTDEAPVSRQFQDVNGQCVATALGCPVIAASGNTFGAISMVFRAVESTNVDLIIAQLIPLLELVVENAPVDSPKNEKPKNDAAPVLQSVVRAADFQSVKHLCFAIANSLCGKLRCEQIAMGLVQKQDIQLVAVSGVSEIPGSTPGVMAIRQAMAVCLDRNEATVSQPDGRLIDQVESSPCKVHEAWRNATSGSCVATLPLRIDGQCVAVIALRRLERDPFCPDDLKRARVLAESFAPALPLVDRANRSMLRHAVDSLASLAHHWCSWNGLGRKAITLGMLAAIAWAVFGKTEHRVMAPCKIVAESVFTVAAPFEGLVRNVLVQPGDHVVAGQPLVQIDTRDLETEKNQVKTQIVSNRIQANALLQERKSQEAFLLQAKIQVLQTEINLIQARIERAHICAPADGIILPTEIHRRIGQYVALGETLLQVADESRCHLEIETPVQQARYLMVNQQAAFLSNARPDQQLDCHITRISPSSEILRQENVVVAEAVLESKDEWMKIGTEGKIRINTGKKPIWWVHLHPVIDFVRVKLWL